MTKEIVPADKPPVAIIIAQAGWVFIGRVTREGDQVVIHEAQNVRRWGTERGLGQLAFEGPTPSTALDHYGTVRLHVLAVVAAVECSREVWP